jgi:hypothetical protein
MARIGVEQDFFPSTSAAILAGSAAGRLLRTLAGVSVAVRDIYAHPTVRKLAEHVTPARAAKPIGDAKAARKGRAAELEFVRRRPRLAHHAVPGRLPVGPDPAVLALPMVIVLPPIMDMLYFRRPILDVILFLIAVGFALWPLLLAVAIGSKWLIIGRYQPGVYPLWGSYYLRWWVVSHLQSVSGLGAFGGTPLAPAMWRMMGARVGRQHAATGIVSASGLHLHRRRHQHRRRHPAARPAHRERLPDHRQGRHRQPLLHRQPFRARPGREDGR